MGVRPSGSSPLTRGKQIFLLKYNQQIRLIPAHAGKTRGCYRAASAHAAHPRSRGENFPVFGRLPLRTGSSPLTRGKRHPRPLHATAPRLIPAHAGKTMASVLSVCPLSAHPRSRGENALLGSRRSVRAGSSPLTRGKRVRHRQVKAGSRLIPAHAGKTWTRNAQTESGEAHPRSRGENDRVGTTEGTVTGSSPLTRGKLPLFGTVPPLWRLIPAHAGKTITRLYRHGNLPAHPRSRGENDRGYRCACR